MARLDSPRNPLVAATLERVRDGVAVPLDGARMLGEALDAGLAVELVFAVNGAGDEALLARARAAGAVVVEVSERVLEKLSSLPSTRGLFAVAPLPARPLPALELGEGGLALLLDGVQDPANVGAMLRAAEAFGAAGALLLEGCASPFTAKALRASAGSAFRLPVAFRLAPGEALAWVAARRATLVGAEAHGGERPGAVERRGPLVLAIGSEGRGLSPEVSRVVARRLTIPLGGRVESLNAAVAAGVLLYALSSASPKLSASKR